MIGVLRRIRCLVGCSCVGCSCVVRMASTRYDHALRNLRYLFVDREKAYGITIVLVTPSLYVLTCSMILLKTTTFAIHNVTKEVLYVAYYSYYHSQQQRQGINHTSSNSNSATSEAVSSSSSSSSIENAAGAIIFCYKTRSYIDIIGIRFFKALGSLLIFVIEDESWSVSLTSTSTISSSTNTETNLMINCGGIACIITSILLICNATVLLQRQSNEVSSLLHHNNSTQTTSIMNGNQEQNDENEVEMLLQQQQPSICNTATVNDDDGCLQP